MKIPLMNLDLLHDPMRQDLSEAIAKVVRSNAFIGGKFVRTFEDEFASYHGSRHAVGVSNGTDALRVALAACGIGPGDEVITSPFTFIATAEAIEMLGARPVFADIDYDSNNLSPERAVAAVTDRTKALIPVHLHGRPADMDSFIDLARERGLRIVADCAQAHGARYKGRGIGTLGDAVTFSFYPGKNLGAFGDAGAVLTEDDSIADRMRMLRDHGRKEKYTHELSGMNCRMDGIQAAVLSVKLKRLTAWTEERREIAHLYDERLKDAPYIEIPVPAEGIESVYHLYAVKVARRDAVQVRLTEDGIATGVHYPIPLHLQPAFAHLGYRKGDFPEAERASETTLSLPMFPGMTEKDVDRVCESLIAACGKRETPV